MTSQRLTNALEASSAIATRLSAALTLTGYHGPLAVAGGYVRDSALGRNPKDMDIWLDGGMIPAGTGEDLARCLCGYLNLLLLGEPEWRLDRKLNSYGTWSKDIDYVCKLSGPPTLVDGHVVPGEIDFIVLRRQALRDAGYIQVTGDQGELATQGLFLSAVLYRVDLRLNAIGGCPDVAACHPKWEDDVANHRLVVQHARVEEDMSRITKRLDRLGSTKYVGWGSYFEGPDGELSLA